MTHILRRVGLFRSGGSRSRVALQRTRGRTVPVNVSPTRAPRFPATQYRSALSVALCALSACASVSADSEPREVVGSIVDYALRADTMVGVYTRVMRPAEFFDSVLIVPDFGEGIMWRVGIENGMREVFGRRGNGPGEYPRPFWALKVHPDSVAVAQGFAMLPAAVIDVSTGRGRTVRFDYWSPDSASPVSAIKSVPFVQYSDTMGNLYAAARSLRHAAGGELQEAGIDARSGITPLWKLRLRDGTASPLGSVKAPESIGLQSETGLLAAGFGPYSPYSGWLVLADGRTITADGATYEIEVRSTEGTIEHQSVIAHRIVGAGAEGFRAYLDSSARGSDVLTRRMLAGAGVEAPVPRRLREQPEAPASFPPLSFGFRGFRTMHAGGDVLWVPVNIEDPPRREVWELLQIGTLEPQCRIGLAANERLLLVTELGAYVSALDELDLERIVLYRGVSERCGSRSAERP